VTSEPYGVPSLSPDGKSLVAVGEGVLYLIAADGSSVTRVTRPQGAALDNGAYPRVASAPSWSPDGSWIVFSFTDRGQEWNIARVRPDGSGFFQITTDAAQETFPDWAP
jgi:Tol biopolymer transport system component